MLQVWSGIVERGRDNSKSKRQRGGEFRPAQNTHWAVELKNTTANDNPDATDTAFSTPRTDQKLSASAGAARHT